MMGLGVAFLVLLALAGAASGKKAPPVSPVDVPPPTPGGPDPKLPTVPSKGKSGVEWVTQIVPTKGEVMPGSATLVDIFLPDGQLGSHPIYRVLRYTQNLTTGTSTPRVLVDAVPGVDQKVIDLAMSDFDIQKSSKPGKVEEMLPLEMQTKFFEILKRLTVDPVTNKIVGPVDSAAIQAATAFAGELSSAGYPEAAATMRAYAQVAAAFLPSPDPKKQIPIPGLPAEMVTAVNRAIQNERDPAKLRDLVAALKKVPQSAERDHAIETIEALIVSIEAKKAADDAKKKIEDVITGKTYVVQPGDTGEKIALKFVGNRARWRELLTVNPTLASKQYGIAVYAGKTIKIPDSWPATPGALPSTPSTPSTPSGPQPTSYVVQSGDTGEKIALKFTGDRNRWRELLTVNPTLADKTYGIRLFAGKTIFLPAGWPMKAPTATTVPSTPTSVPSTATPLPEPAAKTPVEMAADAVAKNLLAVQARYGMPGAKGKEDITLVKRFQAAVGETQDGMVGPGTMARIAQNGVSTLPLVMRWPKSATSAKVIEYRSVLNKLADQADAAGDEARASELRASAARERGQAGIVGSMPA